MLAFLAALAVADCSTSPSMSPLASGDYRLPVERTDLLCAGGGLIGDFVLHGAPSDPHIAWLTLPDGSRVELVWPLGYVAQFTPSLTVVDEGGNVIAREGSKPTGACSMGTNGEWLLEFSSPPTSDSESPGRTRRV